MPKSHDITPETRMLLGLGDLSRELTTIVNTLTRQRREATPAEKKKIIEIRAAIQRIRKTGEK